MSKSLKVGLRLTRLTKETKKGILATSSSTALSASEYRRVIQNLI